MSEATYRGAELERLHEYLRWLRGREDVEVINVTVTRSAWVVRVLLASPEKLPPEG